MTDFIIRQDLDAPAFDEVAVPVGDRVDVAVGEGEAPTQRR
jgi:hypothetical protein